MHYSGCCKHGNTRRDPMATPGVNLRMLESYLGGKWMAGTGDGTTLINPATGEAVGWCSSSGADLRSALDYSRKVGGPGLRALSYSARADRLGKIADLLAGDRERWLEIAQKNSGNTKADASIDVDGAIGTLKYFARLAGKLGETALMTGGPGAGVGQG